MNEDAKDILSFAIDVANAASDGFDWSDLGVLTGAPSALTGWGAGVDNLKELIATDEGRKEIEDFVKKNFDIPNDVLEEKIEKSIAWAFATYDLYNTWTPVSEG